jgi:hypothetical protein
MILITQFIPFINTIITKITLHYKLSVNAQNPNLRLENEMTTLHFYNPLERKLIISRKIEPISKRCKHIMRELFQVRFFSIHFVLFWRIFYKFNLAF